MQVILSLTFTLFLSSFVFAQFNSIEKNFEKNKRSFSVTKFGFGEDASSGWNYLVYRQKTSTKKIRAIWSNYNSATVEDYFYEAGKPVLMVEYHVKYSQYKRLANGVNIDLKAKQKLYFNDSKLVAWIENGKNVAKSDARWFEKENMALASFNENLETYRMFLNGEL